MVIPKTSPVLLSQNPESEFKQRLNKIQEALDEIGRKLAKIAEELQAIAKKLVEIETKLRELATKLGTPPPPSSSSSGEKTKEKPNKKLPEPGDNKSRWTVNYAEIECAAPKKIPDLTVFRGCAFTDLKATKTADVTIHLREEQDNPDYKKDTSKPKKRLGVVDNQNLGSCIEKYKEIDLGAGGACHCLLVAMFSQIPCLIEKVFDAVSKEISKGEKEKFNLITQATPFRHAAIIFLIKNLGKDVGIIKSPFRETIETNMLKTEYDKKIKEGEPLKGKDEDGSVFQARMAEYKKTREAAYRQEVCQKILDAAAAKGTLDCSVYGKEQKAETAAQIDQKDAAVQDGRLIKTALPIKPESIKLYEYLIDVYNQWWKEHFDRVTAIQNSSLWKWHSFANWCKGKKGHAAIDAYKEFRLAIESMKLQSKLDHVAIPADFLQKKKADVQDSDIQKWAGGANFLDWYKEETKRDKENKALEELQKLYQNKKENKVSIPTEQLSRKKTDIGESDIQGWEGGKDFLAWYTKETSGDKINKQLSELQKLYKKDVAGKLFSDSSFCDWYAKQESTEDKNLEQLRDVYLEKDIKKLQEINNGNVQGWLEAYKKSLEEVADRHIKSNEKDWNQSIEYLRRKSLFSQDRERLPVRLIPAGEPEELKTTNLVPGLTVKEERVYGNSIDKSQEENIEIFLWCMATKTSDFLFGDIGVALGHILGVNVDVVQSDNALVTCPLVCDDFSQKTITVKNQNNVHWVTAIPAELLPEQGGK